MSPRTRRAVSPPIRRGEAAEPAAVSRTFGRSELVASTV